MSESKKDISSDYNSVFDQNAPTEVDIVFENREYQQALFGQEIDGFRNEILYTRTRYIKDYTDITENCKKETKEQIKCILITFGASLLLLLLSTVIQNIHNNLVGYVGVLGAVDSVLYLFKTIINVSLRFVPEFLILGYILRIIKLKKMKKRALEHLEKIKQEHMESGTYDAGK